MGMDSGSDTAPSSRPTVAGASRRGLDWAGVGWIGLESVSCIALDAPSKP